MRVLLSPRARPAYGQDFVLAASVRNLHMERIFPGADQYFGLPSETSLVASHDLTYASVSRCFCEAPPHIYRVAHLHLQWGYGTAEVQNRISDALERTHLGIVPAEFLQTEMIGRFPNVRWVLVRNGVDGTRFKPSTFAERVLFRKQLGLDAASMVWIFVGRLEDSKGLGVLRSIVPHLRSANAHLLLQFPAFSSARQNARSAEVAAGLQSLDPGRVHLWPDADPTDVDRPLGCCDLLLHPSLSEVAPLTWIEAWMSGVPVLATRSTPFCDEINHLDLYLVDLPSEIPWSVLPQNQLRIDRSTADGIAEKLLTCAEEIPVLSDSMRLALAQSAREVGFSERSMIQAISDEYTRLGGLID